MLAPFVDLDPLGSDVENYGAWLHANKSLGETWVAVGITHDAIRILERAAAIRRELRRPGINGGFEWLMVRDLLAQCYRRVGRTANAVPIEAELRMLLRFADEDHPVRRRLAGLDWATWRCLHQVMALQSADAPHGQA